ncbi:MAG TPA: hypothetical protein VM165_25455 [Planctomycetaceae bacterium]|nr:hypothetical protein [Planctomycetaceae bacterium]
MDKLEPILKQKFWIILGLGVIMTITGWWMATGSLAATITQRKDALKKAEESIPSGEIPNNDWSNKLSQINVRQEAMVSSVRRALWQQQKDTYFWPQNVDEYARDAAYRSEFNLTARELYRSYYPGNAEEVWKRVRPVTNLDDTGIVMFPFAKMPSKRFGQLAPRSDEIWDAQEDLWLLVPILDAIRAVNGGESGTRLDAVVHIIDRLELMGGERAQGEGGATAAGSGGSDAGGLSAMPGGSYAGGAEAGGSSGFEMGGGMGGSGGTGGGAGATPKVAADFDFKEEFGSSGVASGGGGGGGGNFFGDAGGSAAMPADDPSGGGVTTAAAVARRYIDDADNLPYKTRGFYMTLVMDHRKVPNLIGELTANGVSPWPIEIVRVQISRINDDDAEGRGLGASGMMAGASGNPGPMSAFGSGSTEDYATPTPTFGASETQFGAPEYGSEGGYPGTMPNAVSGLSFDAALSDPFISRVAIAGLIYIYKPVDAPAAGTEGSAAPPATASDPAVTDPTAAATAPVADGTAPATGETAPSPADGLPAEPAATPAPAATEPQPVPETPADTPNPAPASPSPPAAAAPAPN